jgi:hypothetical protein
MHSISRGKGELPEGELAMLDIVPVDFFPGSTNLLF